MSSEFVINIVMFKCGFMASCFGGFTGMMGFSLSWYLVVLDAWFGWSPVFMRGPGGCHGGPGPSGSGVIALPW